MIIRPKQTPHQRRKSGQEVEEEEIKVLAATSEEMNGWLEAIRSEIEASEEQGQNIFNTAWSIIRSYIDNPPDQDESCVSLADAGGGLAAAVAPGDFVHVS